MCEDGVYKLWEDFCKELKEENRFFIQNKIINILEGINFEPFHKGEVFDVFYRARVGNYLYEKDREILAPPKEVTLDGRCNPKGIPYLYLSTDIDTAISEVKPNRSEEVTVAKLDVNLSNILSLKHYRIEKRFWEKLTEEQIALIQCIDDHMGRKINDKSKVEYLPFQYIAEYIKKIGFNGLFYSSTVGDGYNLVMFDWENGRVTVSDKEIFKIKSVEYKFYKIK